MKYTRIGLAIIFLFISIMLVMIAARDSENRQAYVSDSSLQNTGAINPAIVNCSRNPGAPNCASCSIPRITGNSFEWGCELKCESGKCPTEPIQFKMEYYICRASKGSSGYKDQANPCDGTFGEDFLKKGTLIVSPASKPVNTTKSPFGYAFTNGTGTMPTDFNCGRIQLDVLPEGFTFDVSGAGAVYDFGTSCAAPPVNTSTPVPTLPPGVTPTLTPTTPAGITPTLAPTTPPAAASTPIPPAATPATGLTIEGTIQNCGVHGQNNKTFWIIKGDHDWNILPLIGKYKAAVKVNENKFVINGYETLEYDSNGAMIPTLLESGAEYRLMYVPTLTAYATGATVKAGAKNVLFDCNRDVPKPEDTYYNLSILTHCNFGVDCANWWAMTDVVFGKGKGRDLYSARGSTKQDLFFLAKSSAQNQREIQRYPSSNTKSFNLNINYANFVGGHTFMIGIYENQLPKNLTIHSMCNTTSSCIVFDNLNYTRD